MKEAIIAFFSHWSTPLATLVLSALPIVELRLAIPYAVHVWSMTPGEAFGLGVLGAMLPFFPLYFGLLRVREWLSRVAPQLTAPVDKILDHGKRRLEKQYTRYGTVALFLLAAIPLPLAGVWTSAVAAAALRIPKREAFWSIFFGTLVAGGIVTALTLTADVVLQ